MTTKTTVFGLQKASGSYPLNEIETNLGWMKSNIKIMELVFREFEYNDIDMDSFCLAMIEGFEKLDLFVNEMQGSIDLSQKNIKEVV